MSPRLHNLRELRRKHYRRWNLKWMPGWWSTGGGPPPGWPTDYFVSSEFWNNSAVSAANHVDISGIYLQSRIKFSKISVRVGAADAVGFYDWGLYSPAGILLANIGPVHLPAAGLVSGTINQGPITLDPGRYVLAITGNAITATFGFNNGDASWIVLNNVAASVGGVLPNSIGAVTPSLSFNPSTCVLSN